MTIDEMKRACEGKEHCVLVLSRRTPTRSERMRLTPRSGPLGRVVGEHAPGRVIVDFLSADVLAWIAKLEGPEL